VVNPSPGGGTSASQTFTVNGPAPTLTSISPTSATVGASATTITLTGTNFAANSTADFNGTTLATTYVSATQLTAVIPASDLAASATTTITVVTPEPGGGTSASQTFTVSAATAGISGHVYVFMQGALSGIPGVTVTLTSTSGGQSTEAAITDRGGYYSFDSLPAGTYQLAETPPSQYLAPTETLGKVNGSDNGQKQTNGFSGIVLGSGQHGTGYNFTSPGLDPSMISLRLFMSSTPPWSQLLLDLHDAPVVALNGSQGTNYSTSLTAGSSDPVSIVNAGTASITTADNGALASLTVRIASRPDGSAETLTANTSVLGSNPPISAKYANGVLSLAGIAAANAYDAVLRTIQYSDTASSPTAGPRDIAFTAYDLIDDSNTATSTVTILPSDPPAGSDSLKDQVLASTNDWLGD